MKTFIKVCITIGSILFGLTLGHIISKTIYPEKTTPEVYHIKFQFDTKDNVSVFFDCNYFAELRDDPYQDKELCIKFLSSEVIHEIFYDLCVADYLQKKMRFFMI